MIRGPAFSTKYTNRPNRRTARAEPSDGSRPGDSIAERGCPTACTSFSCLGKMRDRRRRKAFPHATAFFYETTASACAERIPLLFRLDSVPPTRLRPLRSGDGSLPDSRHAIGRDPFPNPPSCRCTGLSGTRRGTRFFWYFETDNRAKKIHAAKRIARPTSSRQVVAFLPDPPASATASALAVGHCGHPACGRITDREAPVTKIRRAHACSVRPLSEFIRFRSGTFPVFVAANVLRRSAPSDRFVRLPRVFRPADGQRAEAETERNYAISTSGVSTATVSPSATSTCLTVPA